MPKSKSIVLNVPKPCTEDWDKMTPTQKGRNCASCNKTVIDFSLYTDRELADFFKNLNINVCGRYTRYQVNRPILLTEAANRSFWYKLFFGTALASWLGITSTVSAQTNTSSTPIQQNDLNQKRDSSKVKPDKESSNFITIKGTAIDSITHQAIAFADIVIESADIGQICGSVTDIDGKFKITLSPDYSGKELVLKCVYEGYEPYSKSVDVINSSIQIKMKVETSSELKIMGMRVTHIDTIKKPDNLPEKTTYRKEDIDHFPKP